MSIKFIKVSNHNCLKPNPPTEVELNDPNVTMIDPENNHERTSKVPTPITITITGDYRQTGKGVIGARIAKLLESSGYKIITYAGHSPVNDVLDNLIPDPLMEEWFKSHPIMIKAE